MGRWSCELPIEWWSYAITQPSGVRDFCGGRAWAAVVTLTKAASVQDTLTKHAFFTAYAEFPGTGP